MIRDKYLNINKLIKNKKLMRLFLVVAHHGGVLRFVGGAVRDALKGIEGSDIDFATDLSPDELVEACTEEGIKTVGIGIKYGTVGVIIDDTMVEVTSLRRDIKTDGRHAIVEFTDNWEEDASRRDLTINAVYADEKGNVFDYYNGIEDLEKGIVRFIGKADQRIKEDYLRILRFFRFYSMFGNGSPDKKALKACTENREELKKLPMERIRDELLKLLLTPRAVETIKIMQENNILSFVMPDAHHWQELEYLKKLFNGKVLESKPLLYLFTLYQPNLSLAENMATRLKFSKKERQKFVSWAEIPVSWQDILDEKTRLHLAYEYGKDFCLEKLLLIAAQNQQDIPNFWDIYSQIEQMSVPEFPLKGKHLIEQGVEPAQIGAILKIRELAWIESDFSLSQEELIRPFLSKVSGE